MIWFPTAGIALAVLAYAYPLRLPQRAPAAATLGYLAAAILGWSALWLPGPFDTLADRLLEASGFPELVRGVDARIEAVARNYGRYRRVTREVPKKFRPDMETALQAMAAAGRMGGDQGTPSACMVHVPFKRRYGAGKAGCLR